MDISTNVEKVVFCHVNENCSSRLFATINSFKVGKYFSQDLVFPSSLILIQQHLFLFNLLSSYLKFKMIFEAGV
jgi:hypothetical protein